MTLRDDKPPAGKIAAVLAALGIGGASVVARLADDVVMVGADVGAVGARFADDVGGAAFRSAEGVGVGLGEALVHEGRALEIAFDVSLDLGLTAVDLASTLLDEDAPVGRPRIGHADGLMPNPAGPVLLFSPAHTVTATLARCASVGAWCVVMADTALRDHWTAEWASQAAGNADLTAPAFVARFGAGLPAGTPAVWLAKGPDGWQVVSTDPR